MGSQWLLKNEMVGSLKAFEKVQENISAVFKIREGFARSF